MVAASFRSLTEMPMRRLHQEPPVTNRRYPRDTGLSIRIALTLLGLGLMYMPLAAWVFGWVWIAGGIRALAVIGFGLLLFLLMRPLFASSLGLASGTEPLGEEEAPELRVAIERLCGMADLPTPAIALLEVDVPNAFTIGRALGENVIVVTRGSASRGCR
jgi:heat shock protein HtpX